MCEMDIFVSGKGRGKPRFIRPLYLMNGDTSPSSRPPRAQNRIRVAASFSLANHSPAMRDFRSVFSEGNEVRERN